MVVIIPRVDHGLLVYIVSPPRGGEAQYCGELGKIANCQAGVYIGYATEQGYTLLDRRLYLPEAWLCDEYAEQRERAGIPDEVQFKTKPQLALQMLSQIRHTLTAQWVAADEAFGRSTSFLDGVADMDLYYFAEVPHNTHVWLSRPKIALRIPLGD